jgi:iron complex transport system ATP-binding protein
MVELRDVGYSAGGARILDGVSVSFAQSRFSVILGPNGAGKSTLLRIATGALHPASGSVRYDGVPVTDIDSTTLARRRAVLSQHIELAFPLAVEDVVLMGRYPHYGRAPSSHDRDIVASALEMVGMLERRRQPYPTLSGGEQQKVQMARVLAQIWGGEDLSGKVLFLDEPTSSLDVHYQITLLDLARSLVERHCTVVAILHDINVALHYGDRFVVMDRGRVACEGGAEAVTSALIERVFGVRARELADPDGGRLLRFTLT